MTRDPIVEEVRRVRRQIEARHGNDLDKLFAHYKRLQRKYAGRLVPPPPKARRGPRTS